MPKAEYQLKPLDFNKYENKELDRLDQWALNWPQPLAFCKVTFGNGADKRYSIPYSQMHHFVRWVLDNWRASVVISKPVNEDGAFWKNNHG